MKQFLFKIITSITLIICTSLLGQFKINGAGALKVNNVSPARVNFERQSVEVIEYPSTGIMTIVDSTQLYEVCTSGYQFAPARIEGTEKWLWLGGCDTWFNLFELSNTGIFGSILDTHDDPLQSATFPCPLFLSGDTLIVTEDNFAWLIKTAGDVISSAQLGDANGNGYHNVVQINDTLFVIPYYAGGLTNVYVNAISIVNGVATILSTASVGIGATTNWAVACMHADHSQKSSVVIAGYASDSASDSHIFSAILTLSTGALSSMTQWEFDSNSHTGGIAHVQGSPYVMIRRYDTSVADKMNTVLVDTTTGAITTSLVGTYNLQGDVSDFKGMPHYLPGTNDMYMIASETATDTYVYTLSMNKSTGLVDTWLDTLKITAPLTFTNEWYIHGKYQGIEGGNDGWLYSIKVD